jgi:hypothetical protein
LQENVVAGKTGRYKWRELSRERHQFDENCRVAMDCRALYVAGMLDARSLPLAALALGTLCE